MDAVRRRAVRAAVALAAPLTALCLVGCGAVGALAGKPLPAATVTVTAPPPTPSVAAATPTTSASPTPSPATTAPPSAKPTTLPAAYERVQGGVIRFEVATCDGDFVGSGFALSDSLVVTAAHVVKGAAVIRVIQGTSSTAGQIIGIDDGADVALVRTTTPLAGPYLHFSKRPPKVGDDIAAIGFPEGDPLSYNPGHVNGLDRKAVIDGIPRHNLIEMDAATTHGSSGGPVIEADGAVYGLVDAGVDGEAGRRLAVSSGIARPLVQQWQSAPDPVPAAACTQVEGPDGTPADAVTDPSNAEIQAITTLSVYFRSINNGDFPTALSQLAKPGSLRKFEADVTSSQDAGFVVRSVRTTGGSPVVWLDFVSTQDKGSGPAARPQETCTEWSLDYHFTQRNGLWLIRTTSQHGSRPTNRPC